MRQHFIPSHALGFLCGQIHDGPTKRRLGRLKTKWEVVTAVELLHGKLNDGGAGGWGNGMMWRRTALDVPAVASSDRWLWSDYHSSCYNVGISM